MVSSKETLHLAECGSCGPPVSWNLMGHHPSMVIVHLSSGSTEPAVHMIRTRLGGPYPRSFPFDYNRATILRLG